MSPERPLAAAGLPEPDLRLSRLRETATLIGRMAGEAAEPPDARLAADARAAVRLHELPPVVRRRYDAVAADTATLARVGLGVLVDLPRGPGVTAAAARLAIELRDGIARMTVLLG